MGLVSMTAYCPVAEVSWAYSECAVLVVLVVFETSRRRCRRLAPVFDLLMTLVA